MEFRKEQYSNHFHTSQLNIRFYVHTEMCRSSESMYLVPQTPQRDEKDAPTLQQMPGVTCTFAMATQAEHRSICRCRSLYFYSIFCWNWVQNSSLFLGLNPSWYGFQPCGSTIKRTFWTSAIAGLLFHPWKFFRRSAGVGTAGPLLLKDACCMCIFIPKNPSAHELVKGRSRCQEHGGGGGWRRVAALQPHPRRLWQSWIWIMLQYNMNLRDLCFHRAAQMSPR